MDEVRIVRLEERDEWDREHRTRGLPGHSWHFAAGLRFSHLEPKLAVVRAPGGSSMVLVFVERLKGDYRDIATVPGLSGASILGDAKAVLAHWGSYARRQGWVSGYLQLSMEFAKADLEHDHECLERLPTFLVDPQTWRLESTAVTIRQKISKARLAGVVAHVRPQVSGQRLHELYATTMDRFGLAPSFTAETLQAWADSPDSLVVAAGPGDQLEAMLLIHRSGTDAEAHLVGTTRAGRDLTALVYCKAIETLREMGVSRFNLGPGGTPGDGLYRFKSWLRGTPVPTYALHQVYDKAAFDLLCREAGISREATRFPPYRYP